MRHAIAALVLWERLKMVGEHFLGAATGAGMFQTAISMATAVVNGLAEGVSILAEIASAFLKMVAMSAKVVKAPGKAMDWVGGEAPTMISRAMDMSKGQDNRDWTDKTMDYADNLTKAASSWRAVDVKNINQADITSWTDTVTAAITDAFKPSEEEKKRKKGP